MNLKNVIIICSLFFTSSAYAQDLKQTLDGTVSFVTSKNVYVKFENTEMIQIGDTLTLNDKNVPCLVVNDKSSSSTVCTVISNCEVKKDDQVSYSYEAVKKIEEDIGGKSEEVTIATIEADTPSLEQREKNAFYSEKIKGRISVSSYNNISENRDDRHRINSRFSLNAKHIGDSKFSIDSYLNYRHLLNANENNTGRKNSIFRVYNLALRFDANPTLSFTVGRKINPKASSLGAIDGLQIEKYLGNFYVGAIAGFRPDFVDFNFNPDLLEYGGYIGLMSNLDTFYSTTTLGFMEQTNSGQVDRRYAYFQHSSSISRKLNLFGSFELDLYGEEGSTVRLTNLYMSARYRFSRKFDLTLSFDSRKRIIYYETFKTEIEEILDDDIARQGIRIRANVKPIKRIVVGGSYSKRTQSDDQNKSDNIYGYITLTKIPTVGGRFSINYNVNSSSYLESQIISFRHSRTMLKRKLNADFYYRLADYEYKSSDNEFKQNYYGASFSYNITRTWIFNVSGELSQFDDRNNYRFYTKLIKRFYSKKKNKR